MKKKHCDKIVAFGDSITLACEQEPGNRWTDLLQAALNAGTADKSTTVINAGVGGNTSREGLARMEKDVLAHRPDLVLVEFGGNDATPVPERAVSLEEYAANLAKMKDAITALGAGMALLTFPPVIDAWHAWKNDQKFVAAGGLDRCVEQYRQATRKFAGENKLLLIDIDQALRSVIKKDSAEKVILPDGVHLTLDGNRVVAQAVFKALADN